MLTTQFQVQNVAGVRKIENFFQNNGRLEAETYPKKKRPFIRQSKFQPTVCPRCRRSFRTEFSHG